MAGWLGEYLFGSSLPVTSDISELTNEPYVINYSDEKLAIPAYHVSPHGLLFQTGIKLQPVEVVESKDLPFFFTTNGEYPFDLLSAIFYLISRYEEYLPHEKDMYGRYAHTNSLAFKNNFLRRPIVDEWMEDFKNKLQAFFPGLQFIRRSFEYIPTYDIDIAWSYLHKGFLLSNGGLLKNIVKGDWGLASERLKTLTHKTTDPFDVFEELNHLHVKYHLQSIYFFLLAEENKGYDKNISPHNKAYQQLINDIAKQNNTGIHFSWQAWENKTCMRKERDLLLSITQQEVTANRMHYIKFDLPATFDQLLQTSIRIKKEYSMGYGSINGFRASTCTPFYWYNLEKEETTSLQILPFAYMEANSIFEQKDNQEKALEELQHYHDIVKKLNGTLITIFHNHLIGRDAEGRKWWNMYENYLRINFSE